MKAKDFSKGRACLQGLVWVASACLFHSPPPFLYTRGSLRPPLLPSPILTSLLLLPLSCSQSMDPPQETRLGSRTPPRHRGGRSSKPRRTSPENRRRDVAFVQYHLKWHAVRHLYDVILNSRLPGMFYYRPTIGPTESSLCPETRVAVKLHPSPPTSPSFQGFTRSQP